VTQEDYQGGRFERRGARRVPGGIRIRAIRAGTTLLVTRIRATTIRGMWDFMAATIGDTSIAGGNS